MFRNKKVLVYVLLCIISVISVFSYNYFQYKEELNSYNDYEGNLVEQMSCDIDDDVFASSVSICSFNVDANVNRLYVTYKADVEAAMFYLVVDEGEDVKTVIEDEWKTFTNNTVYTTGRVDGFKHYAEINGDLEDKELVFFDDDVEKIDEIRTDSDFNFNWMHVSAISAFLIFIITFIAFYNFFTSKIEITFLFISLFIGLILVLIIPPFSIFDEAQHFIKAYNDSIFELGDIRNTFIQQSAPLNSTTALNLGAVNRMFVSAVSSPITNIEPPTTAAPYVSLAYFANSFGISFGKIFTMNFVALYYMGKASNVIIYSILSYFLLKYTKVFKLSTFALLLLPTTLFFKAAYTLDFVVLFSLITVFLITFNVLLKGDENASKYEYIVFAIASVMLLFAKIPYVIFILIFFIVPKKKDIPWSNWLKPRIGIAIVVISAILVSLIYQKFKVLVQWNLDSVDPVAQVNYMVNNPGSFLNIWYNHALFLSDKIVKTVVSEFAYNGFIVDETGGFSEVITSLLFVGFTAIVVYDVQFMVDKLKKSHRFVILTLIVVSYFVIVAALYITFNPVGADIVLGVQARYVTPFYLPLVVALTPNLKIAKDKLLKSYQYAQKYVVFYALICVILTFAYFIGYLA